MNVENPTTQDVSPGSRPAARVVRLVIVEADAEESGALAWPDGDGGDHTVVVRQAQGESAVGLAGRAIARLAAIERSGGAVHGALLLLSHRGDDQSMAVRQLIARAVLVHVSVLGIESAQMVLAVGGSAAAALRPALLSLVDGLVSTPGSCAVPIRVHFGPPARTSGVRPRSVGFRPQATVVDDGRGIGRRPPPGRVAVR